MIALAAWASILCVLPFISLGLLWRKTSKGLLDWSVASSLVGAFALLAFIAGPWALTSVYLRFLLIVLYALAVFRSLRNVTKGHPSLAQVSKPAIAAKLVALVLLVLLDVVIIKSFFYPGAAVGMTFPLSHGAFYVVPNLLHPTGAKGDQERYALDIVRLSPSGNRATGFRPRDLTSYAIYGAEIYSPCTGIVVEITDGVEDNAIGDSGHGASNQIVIRCGVVTVTLAHLLKGSLLASRGEFVSEGQLLGRVGNSGHSAEPHLHIDAVREVTNGSSTGVKPVALSFGGKVLTPNSIFRK